MVFLIRKLKELALKYNIEVKEKKLTPDQIDKENKRDGIYLISSYKTNFFKNNFGKQKKVK